MHYASVSEEEDFPIDSEVCIATELIPFTVLRAGEGQTSPIKLAYNSCRPDGRCNGTPAQINSRCI